MSMDLKKIALCVLILGTASCRNALSEIKIDRSLTPFAEGRARSQTLRVLVLMDIRNSKIPLPRRYDRSQALGYFRQLSSANWKKVEFGLRNQKALGTHIRNIHFYQINSSFSADVTPSGLKALSQTEGVSKIYANHRVRRDLSQTRRLTGPRSKGPSYAFEDTGLARLITEWPQVTGAGVLLGHIDTGVDGTHPALAGKILHFFDLNKKKYVTPARDLESHGTHTAGIMVAGPIVGPAQTRIGVAPGAKLLSVGPIDDLDFELASMEFLLNPDQNPQTADFPKVVNSSWNCEGAPDVELFYRAISAWDAAGIIPVFSAGNLGAEGDGSLTPPHEHPVVIAVGATQEDGRIADYSSHGPAIYEGKTVPKPDLVAPGNQIVSTLPGGEFGQDSGTSMAAPQVTAAIALILQVAPGLNPAQVRSILVSSASPRNEQGGAAPNGTWNKIYGFGKLNIYGAVHLAAKAQNVRFENTSGRRGLLSSFLNLSEPWTADSSWIDSSLMNTDLSGAPERADPYVFPADLEGTAWITATDMKWSFGNKK